MKNSLKQASFTSIEALWDFFAAHKLAGKHTSSFYADGRYHLVWCS